MQAAGSVQSSSYKGGCNSPPDLQGETMTNIPVVGWDAEEKARLEGRLKKLEARIEALESRAESIGITGTIEEFTDEKTPLVTEAVELGIGPKSTLSRWSVEKLQAAIAEKKGAAL